VKQGARLLLHSTTKTNQGKAKAQPRFHGLILIKFTSACMDCRRPIQAFFLLKSRTFGLRQTNWADKFWGIWGIFGTHFGPWSIISTKNEPFISTSQIFIWDWDLNLNLGRKELGI
jgi:hypothetical protein